MIEDIYLEIIPELKDRLVFDIGAASGKMTRIFLDSGAKVVAVEPQKDRTTSDSPNFIGDVTIINACVSNFNGGIEFNHCKSSPNISSCNSDWKNGLYSNNNQKWVSKRKAAITLDSLITYFGNPYYIKVDVEGYEDKVLEGLSYKCDIISLEYTGGYDEVFMPCIERLEKIGFTKLVAFEKIKENTSEGRIARFERTEFTSFSDCVSYYKSLQKFTQGDLLVR